MNAGDLATYQQNLVSLFEVARSHHQQLTSFSILVILGALGFAVTDTFRHTSRSRRIALAVAVVMVEIAIGVSIYQNAAFHNRILAEAVSMNKAPAGAPDIKAVLAGVDDAPPGLLFALHVSVGILVGLFMSFVAPRQFLATDPVNRSKGH